MDTLTKEEQEILQHTQNRAANGLFCGDSPSMQSLIRKGLMIYAGQKPFCPDKFFRQARKQILGTSP